MLMKHKFIKIGIGINNGKIYYTAQFENIVVMGYPLETSIEHLEQAYRQKFKEWLDE